MSKVGYNNKGQTLVHAPSHSYREWNTSASPVSGVGFGGSHSVDIFIQANEVLKDIVLMVDIANSSLTDTIEFRSFLEFYQSVELKLDNRPRCVEHRFPDEIVMACNRYYAEKDTDDALIEHGINNGLSSMSTNSVAPNSTKRVEVSLMPLLHSVLKNSRGTHWQKCSIVCTLRSASSASEASRFVRNATANTNPLPLLTFNNLTYRSVAVGYHPSALAGSTKSLIHKYEVISRPSVNLSVVGSKPLKFNLSNDWSRHNRITALYLWISSSTTYNASLTYTALSSLGTTFYIKGKDEIHQTSSAMKQYQRMYHQQMSGRVRYDYGNATMQALIGTINEPVFLTFCASGDRDSHEVIAGITNDQNTTYELELEVIGSGLPASCTVYCAMEYLELAEQDAGHYSLRV